MGEDEQSLEVTEESENTTETADQSTEESEVQTEEGEAEDNSESTETDTANQQSNDDNAKYASIRRKAESDAKAAYERREAELNSRVTSLFGQYKNPKTGAPITNMSDYLDAITAQQQQQFEQQAKDAGIDTKALNNLIENNPVVLQAKQAMSAVNSQEANRMIAEDLAAIHRMDASVNNFDDVAKQDNYADVANYVQTHPGIRLSDAYKIVNFDRLTSEQAKAGRQAAINQARSKEHLNTGSGAAGIGNTKEIPVGELARWKEFFPDKTSAQLKELYNKTQK